MSESSVNKGERATADVVRLDRRKLLIRHLRGDLQAFPELMQIYGSTVFSCIVRSGIPANVRDDVFQEIFIKIHQRADTYHAERPLEPWLFAIMANTVRSHYRKARVREIVQHEADSAHHPEPLTGADFAEARETSAWLSDAIQKLPFQQREVIILCCIKELSQKDVAKILDMPVNTVKTNLSRGRAALAKALSRRRQTLRREVGHE